MTNHTTFLSYAREDLMPATRLYQALSLAGVEVWMDKVSLRPGEQWEPSIRKAISKSRYFLAVMSSSSSAKRGFIQKEIRYALEVLDQFPDNEIFLLPVRLDDCQPSHIRLRDLNWTDLFPEWDSGLARILSVLLPSPVSREETFASLSGLYQSHSPVAEFNNAEFFGYFRFYPDGIVIAASTSDTPAQMSSWFVREKADSMGHYRITDGSIAFTNVSKEGAVDYEGEIVGGDLILRVHSHITGWREVRTFGQIRE